MYDVIVIGGGITGAGVLRDCALRGLKALLLEKGSAGHATTASSTHLIHGGLRYLLYDRPTTVTSCWDSGNIVNIAKPLLTRLPIVWPVYRNHTHSLETVETLLEAYDHLSAMKHGLPHLRLNAEETLRLFPAMRRDGLIGSVTFDEWWVDPVRLVEANIASAKGRDAHAKTQTLVSQAIIENGRVAGVRTDSGEEFRATLTINAAGPWADRIATLAGLHVPLRLQKGTHLVYTSPIACLPKDRPIGLLLEAEDRERYIFVVSSGHKTLLGPTDLPGGDDPDLTATDNEEVRYLLSSARLYFPDFPQQYDRSSVGARPILAQVGSEKNLSREYEVIDHETRDRMPGIITVVGGKMSDFRLMAQDAVDLACKKLGKTVPCQTHIITLDGKTVKESQVSDPPSKAEAKFLRKHPNIRQLHALSWLGFSYVCHIGKKLLRRPTPASLEDFATHYR